MANQRVGIFGGSFDPVHLGHLVLADRCREACELDEVRFVPAADPPHKQSGSLVPGKQRAEMLEFATAGIPEFAVDRRELKRDGKNYTVDTLTELRSELPDSDLFFLIGADSLHDLPTWREPERILQLATIVAVNRGDDPLPDLTDVESRFGDVARGRIRFVTIPGLAISSTEIRDRVRTGRTVRFLAPRAVEAYIAEHGLYTGVDGRTV